MNKFGILSTDYIIAPSDSVVDVESWAESCIGVVVVMGAFTKKISNSGSLEERFVAL